MPLTMPTMRVNASTADVGIKRVVVEWDNMPFVVRTYRGICDFVQDDGFYASFRANSTM